jgi:hypothetical protein
MVEQQKLYRAVGSSCVFVHILHEFVDELNDVKFHMGLGEWVRMRVRVRVRLGRGWEETLNLEECLGELHRNQI